MCGFIDWNKIWLNCVEYDLTEKHSYHFDKLYLAVDGVICFQDAFLKNYKLDCEMVHGCVYPCEKCDTFYFRMENNEGEPNRLRKYLKLHLYVHEYKNATIVTGLIIAVNGVEKLNVLTKENWKA